MDNFAEIDEIEWGQLRHSYGHAQDVPDLLRALIHADVNDWERRLETLINTIFHQNDVHNATVATMPFLVRYLDDCPDEKLDILLLTLRYIAESCERDFNSAQKHKPYLDTFQTILDGYRKYIPLLQHRNLAVRFFSAQLLGLASTYQDRIRIHSYHALRQETDPMTLWALLITLSRLSEQTGKRAVLKYRQLFAVYAEVHPDPRVRLAASSAWLYSRHQRPYFWQQAPMSIILSIGQALLEPLDLAWDFFYPPDYSVQDDLGKLTIHELAMLLELDGLTPWLAHCLIREMLDAVFPRLRTNDPKRNKHFSISSWSHYLATDPAASTLTYRITDEGLIYRYRAFHLAEKTTLEQARQFVLTQLVRCAVFWEQPTNLLSYIYGLPDDKAHVASLIDSHSL